MKRLSHSFHWIIQPLLVLAVLAVGFFGAMGLSLFKEEPRKGQRPDYAPLIRVTPTQVNDREIVIDGNGTVEARTRINIVPQIGGKVSYIHPDLRAGGRFQKNRILVEIERIDYELAVTAAEADVAQARTSLQLEQAEADAARAEWSALNGDQPLPPLVGREPQLAEASAQVKAAEARLKQAQLDLDRTQIRMPFNGRVVETDIDVGEVVSANEQIGVVYSNERFEIRVPLEIEELAWISAADQSKHTKGSDVIVHVPTGQNRTDITGEVTRIESELDERSRFAYAVVTVNGKSIPESLRDIVVPGLFTDISIKSRTLHDVTTLPRVTLREGNVLWIVKNDQVEFVQPDIVYQTETDIVIRGLPANTLIITGDVDVITQGMQVRIASSEQESDNTTQTDIVRSAP